MTSRSSSQKWGLDVFVETYRLDSEIDPARRTTTHKSIVTDVEHGLRKVARVEHWTTQGRIGRGGFGNVYLQKRSTGETRAVKELDKQFSTDQKQDFLRELVHTALFAKDHACFPLFMGWYEDKERIYLAMEYFELGDLDSCLSQHHSDPLTEPEVQTIVSQVTEALSMLHAKGISHRDLKPQNVFVRRKGPEWWVKLGDFGISKSVLNDETALYTQYLGPFVAPEVRELTEVDEDGQETYTYTNAVDIWSLGCLTYWLLTRQTLFSEPRSLGRYCKAGNKPPTEAVHARMNSHGLELLHRCLSVQSKQRPTAHEILASEWLKGASQKIDFDRTSDKTVNTLISNLNSIRLAEVGFNFHFAREDLAERAQRADQEELARRTILVPKSVVDIRPSKPSKIKKPPSNRPLTTGPPADKKPKAAPQGSIFNLQAQAKEERPQPTEPQIINVQPDLTRALEEFSKTGPMISSKGALTWATSRGYLALAQLILKTNHHPDLDERLESEDVRTGEILSLNALHHLAMTRGEELSETVQALLAKNVDIEARDHRKRTPLLIAAEYGNPEAVKLLLETGANVEAQTQVGITPLMQASKYGHEEIAELLLTAGAYTTVSDSMGRTPLAYAATAGSREVTRLLLAAGAPTESQDSFGRTPLILAALDGHREVLELLLAAGAKINAQDKLGRTALVLANQGRHTDIAEVLVSAGALVMDTHDRKTPQTRHGRRAIVQLPGRGSKTPVS